MSTGIELKKPECLKYVPDTNGDYLTTFLYFQEREHKGKTRKWIVLNKMHGIEIGKVKWSTSFRKYAFFPERDTVYEQVCLRDIADFIEYRTGLHKQERKREKERNG